MRTPKKQLDSMRRYYLKNRDKLIEINKKYYAENKEYVKARIRTYRRNNLEKLRQREAKYLEVNRTDRVVAQCRYSKENRVKRNIIAANRNARIKENGGVLSFSDIEDLKQKQENKCFYCSNEFDGDCHMEHKIPIKMGGRNDIDNVVFACRACNLSKGIKTAEEFIGAVVL